MAQAVPLERPPHRPQVREEEGRRRAVGPPPGLDELFAIADRIAVMFQGVLSEPRRDWTVAAIGLALAGSGEGAVMPRSAAAQG